MIPNIEDRWLIAAGVMLLALVVGFGGRAVVASRLARLAKLTATDLDDLIFAALRNQVIWWLLLGAAALAVRVAELPAAYVAAVDRVVGIGLVITVTLAVSNLLTRLVERQARQADAAVGTTSLARQVVKVLVLALGGIMLLANLGVSITPLLTALGVGSLAVALALQPTLSNLFAGIHLSLARPIRVGDFIELENGRTGFVTDIGWRAIHLRELPNNDIIIPNSKVAEMMLINYNMPENEQSALVQMGVAYGSDLAKVERVVVDVARQVLKDVQGGVTGFDPFIRYHTFGDSSINFSVILRVQTFVDRYLVTHEFVKRVKARFDQEGIEIPFPQRVLHAPLLEQESLAAPADRGGSGGRG